MYDSRKMTLKDFWYHTARDRVKKDARTDNFGKYLDNMAENIMGELGNYRMSDISTEQINTYLKSIRNLSTGAQQNHKALLRRIFTIAQELRIVATNPVDGTDIIRTPYVLAKKLPDNTLVALLSHNANNLYQSILAIQIYSGLSISEIIALFIEDLDLKNNAIHIHRFAKRDTKTKRTIFSDSHNCRKQRKIYIPHMATKEFIKVLKITDAYRSNGTGHQPLFIDFTGDHLGLNYVQMYYREMALKNHLSSLTGRMLEENFGVRAAELKINPKDLQVYLGYKTCFTVAKYYNSVKKDHIEPAVAAEDYYIQLLNQDTKMKGI